MNMNNSGEAELEMHEARGLQYHEIAKLEGIPLGTVASRIRRARERRDSASYPEPQTATVLDDEKIDALLKIAQAVQSEMADVDPIITHKIIDVHSSKPICIALMGCMHFGGRYMVHELVRRHFDALLAHPEIHLGLFGDELGGFLSGSFAGAMSVMEQGLQVPLQIALFERFLDKIKERSLWGCSSQHGTDWMRKLGFNPVKQAYLKREIAFFDGQGYVKLNLGDQSYHIAVAHEFPGTSMLNPTHAQRRALWQRYPNADVVAMADRHQFAITQMDVYGNEEIFGNRPTTEAWLVQIGTSQIGPDPYTIKGWERGQFGWPYLVLWPHKHQVKVTRDLDDALRWLNLC